MNETTRRPWERGEDEPEQWYGRFREYMRLGNGRTIEEVYKAERFAQETGRLAELAGTDPHSGEAKGSKGKQRNEKSASRPTRHWYDAAKRWKWSERARAWDHHQLVEQDKEWGQRQRSWREQRWQLKEKLIQKVNGMLNFPLTQVRREYAEEDPITGNTNTTIQVIEPADWRLRDVALLIKAMETLMEESRNDQSTSDAESEGAGTSLEELLEQMVRATYGGNVPPGTGSTGHQSSTVSGSSSGAEKL